MAQQRSLVHASFRSLASSLQLAIERQHADSDAATATSFKCSLSFAITLSNAITATNEFFIVNGLSRSELAA